MTRAMSASAPRVAQRRVAARARMGGQQAAGPTHAERPQLLGHERDDRMREDERLAHDVQQVARRAPSSNSRPLMSSRYQSHSSP